MGSDGGLSWIRVNNKARLLELVLPLGIYEFQTTGPRGTGDDSRWSYLAGKPELTTSDYFVTAYGTDIPGIPGADDICELVAESSGVLGEFTFADIVEDKLTETWAPNYSSSVSRVIFEFYMHELKYGNSSVIKSLLDAWGSHPIMSMKFKTWGHEVIDAIGIKRKRRDYLHADSVETWT